MHGVCMCSASGDILLVFKIVIGNGRMEAPDEETEHEMWMCLGCVYFTLALPKLELIYV